MPFSMSQLNHRDPTVGPKIPASKKGFGAFTAGGGFGLFVSVPVALVAAATGAIFGKAKKKKAKKEKAEEEDEMDKGESVKEREGKVEERNPLSPVAGEFGTRGLGTRDELQVEQGRQERPTSLGMLAV